MFKMQWYGPEYLKKLKKHNAGNLKRACIFLRNDVVKSISTKAGPCREARKKKNRVGIKYNHSQPGQPPHLICNRLRQSIAFEVDEAKLIGRVGSSQIYARYLELGWKHGAARPFLFPALVRNQHSVARILASPMTT